MGVAYAGIIPDEVQRRLLDSWYSLESLSRALAAQGSSFFVAERIRRARESLMRVSQTLAEAMYRETKGGTGGPRTSGAPTEGEVVDAEFKDVDDRKS